MLMMMLMMVITMMWSTGWPTRSPANWLARQPTGWPAGWPHSWLAGPLAGLLLNWLAGWSAASLPAGQSSGFTQPAPSNHVWRSLVTADATLIHASRSRFPAVSACGSNFRSTASVMSWPASISATTRSKLLRPRLRPSSYECPCLRPVSEARYDSANRVKRFSNVSDEDSSSSVGTLTHGSPERPNEMITCARSVPTCDALFRQRPKYVRTSNVSTQASEYSESARR